MSDIKHAVASCFISDKTLLLKIVHISAVQKSNSQAAAIEDETDSEYENLVNSRFELFLRFKLLCYLV